MQWFGENVPDFRLQNSPYFCVFKTLTPRFTDFFTGFDKKTDCFAVYPDFGPSVDWPMSYKQTETIFVNSE